MSVDVRFSRLDYYRLRWFPFTEANFGNSPNYATDTSLWLGIPVEVAIMNDPEFEPLWGLEPASGGEGGDPFAILSHKTVAKVKFNWYQQTLAAPYRYWQKDFLKKPSADNYTNFWLNFWVHRGDTECMSWFWRGCKPDTITIRGEAAENKPILWSAECLAKLFETGTYRGTNSFQSANPNAPWLWSDVHLQSSTNGTDFTLIPEVKSFECTLRNHLYANYTFNVSGSKELISLDPTKYEAKLTFKMNMRNISWYDYMKNQTQLWFRIAFPDSKLITLKKCKITAKPSFSPDMDLAQLPVEVTAQEWDHNF